MLKKSLQYTNSNFKKFLFESHPFKVTSYLSETGNILEVRDFMHGITRLLKTEHLSAVITIQVKLDKEVVHYTFYASKLARQLQTGVAVKKREREREREKAMQGNVKGEGKQYYDLKFSKKCVLLSSILPTRGTRGRDNWVFPFTKVASSLGPQKW